MRLLPQLLLIMQACYRNGCSDENNAMCMLFLGVVGNRAQAASLSQGSPVISDALAAQALAEATSTCHSSDGAASYSRHWRPSRFQFAPFGIRQHRRSGNLSPLITIKA